MILKEADIIVTKLRAFCKTIFLAISVKNFPTILQLKILVLESFIEALLPWSQAKRILHGVICNAFIAGEIQMPEIFIYVTN